jgi:hypothetical protein
MSRQYKFNIIMRRVYVTTVAVEKAVSMTI